MGAIFIRVNNRINAIRKRILKTNKLKILEALILTFLTVSAMYLCLTFNYWFAGKINYLTNTNFCQIKS